MVVKFFDKVFQFLCVGAFSIYTFSMFYLSFNHYKTSDLWLVFDKNTFILSCYSVLFTIFLWYSSAKLGVFACDFILNKFKKGGSSDVEQSENN